MILGLKKSDVLASLLIGEAAGCLIAVILKNIAQTVPQLEAVPLWVWPAFFPVFCLAWFVFMFLVSKKIVIAYQLGKFVLVGGLNFLVDLGVLNLLLFITAVTAGWLYSVFKAAAFIVAVINSYLLNKFWTFKKKDEAAAASAAKTGKEFATFIAVSVTGLIINALTASLIVNWVGPQWGISAQLWANIGAVTAAFVSMFWNFVGYKFIVFKG